MVWPAFHIFKCRYRNHFQSYNIYIYLLCLMLQCNIIYIYIHICKYTQHGLNYQPGTTSDRSKRLRYRNWIICDPVEWLFMGSEGIKPESPAALQERLYSVQTCSYHLGRAVQTQNPSPVGVHSGADKIAARLC